MKVAIVGGVVSTKSTILKLLEHNFEIEGIFGYVPKETKNVSGYVNLEAVAIENNVPFYPFERINSPEIIDSLSKMNLDVLFVVGLSQLVSDDLINLPRLGTIGFHPTQLPKGRGRAPIAWLVLDEMDGAATFFQISKGVDDGPIMVQEPFKVDSHDNAASVEEKILSNIDKALDRWLPDLKLGNWNQKVQDDSIATYYGKRAPLDGCIDWTQSNISIDRLVKASTFPHPGAFSFYGDLRVVILESIIETVNDQKGVIGRVLQKSTKGLLVQTGDGLVWLTNYYLETRDNEIVKDKELLVGSRLGYYSDFEIFKLRNEIAQLKEEIKKLK